MRGQKPRPSPQKGTSWGSRRLGLYGGAVGDLVGESVTGESVTGYDVGDLVATGNGRGRRRRCQSIKFTLCKSIKFTLCDIDCACARAFALRVRSQKRFSSPARAWHIPSSDWALAAVSPRLGWVSQSRRQATWSDSPPAKECPGLPASLQNRRRPGRRRGAPRRGRGCRTRPRVWRAKPARQQRRSRGVPTFSLYADEPPGCLRSKRRTDDESGSSAAR